MPKRPCEPVIGLEAILEELERRNERAWFGAACVFEEFPKVRILVCADGKKWGDWVKSARARYPGRDITVYDSRTLRAVAGFVHHA